MEGDGKPSTCSSFVRRMGLTFENFIPIHQAQSHRRKPLLTLRQDVPDADSGMPHDHFVHGLPSGMEREPAAMKYRAAPGTATTGNRDNDTPVQSQSERDSVFQREAVADNENSRQRTCRG